MAKPTINKNQQTEATIQIRELFNSYEDMNTIPKERFMEIYEHYRRFKSPKTSTHKTNFWANKSHEIINNKTAKISGRSPSLIASLRTDKFNIGDSEKLGQDRVDMLEKYGKMAAHIQEYLTSLFENYGQKELGELWLKNTLAYGNGFASVEYKYIYDIVDGEEKIIGEYPSIEVISFKDIYIDPRYRNLSDMPGVIFRKNGVKLNELKASKKYFNLDKLEELGNLGAFGNDQEGYNARVEQITGISTNGKGGVIDKNSLSIIKYEGLIDLGDGMKLYRVEIVNEVLVIAAEPISYINLECMKAFVDLETFYATGFIEPIMSLENELNFGKNASATYINQSLYRKYLINPKLSGINPATLNSGHGNQVVTDKPVNDALNNLQEIPHRQLAPQYFQQQTSIETDIQRGSFSVDVSQQNGSQQMLTTATGTRIAFFASNENTALIRKHYEEAIKNIAYKMLKCTYENMTDNIIIKNSQGKFLELNKELFRDAVNRYDIRVEANSSSFDSIETRRNDAIAKWNLANQMVQAGVKVDMTKAAKDILGTFEGVNVNEYITDESPMQAMGNAQIKGEENQNPNPAELTKQVAGGNLPLS